MFILIFYSYVLSILMTYYQKGIQIVENSKDHTLQLTEEWLWWWRKCNWSWNTSTRVDSLTDDEEVDDKHWVVSPKI